MDKPSIFRAVVKRRMLPALTSFASVIVAAIAYLAFTPRLYETSARLMLNDNQLSVSELGRDLGRLPSTNAGGPNPLATQAELVKSQRILNRAIAQMQSNHQEQAPTIAEIKSGLRVKIVPATNILELSYRDQKPKVAAELLNAVTAAMLEENIENIRASARSIRTFLETEVPKQRAVLEELETLENSYRQSNGLVSVEAQTDQLVQNLGSAENQERELAAQLQDLTTQKQSLQHLIGQASLKQAYTSARVGQDEELKTLRTKLDSLDAQVIEMRSRLGDQHPDLIALTEQRDETQKLYEAKLSRVSSAPSTEPQGLAGDALSQDLIAKLITTDVQRAALEQKLTVIRKARLDLQSRLIEIPRKEQPLTTLIRAREEAESTLRQLQSKLQEARIAEAQLISNIKIISIAEPPVEPAWPKKSSVLVIAVVFGTVLAVGIVLLLELLDSSLHHSNDAEDILGQPSLGTLPPLASAHLDRNQAEFFLDNVHLVEPYRKLLKTLEFRSGKQLRLLAIGSALANEGKSTVVAHLAAVSAMLSQKTLIIDTDLRRPKQHRLFNLQSEPGLTDVISGDLSLYEAVQETHCKNLFVLTCGSRSQRPSLVLESAMIQAVLKEAANSFDLIILDTPPINNFADALALSRYSDGLMLVIRPGLTTRNGLFQAVKEQQKSGVSLMGFVANDADNSLDHDYFGSNYQQKHLSNFLPSLSLKREFQGLSAIQLRDGS